VIHEVVPAMAAHATVRDLAEATRAFPNFAEGSRPPRGRDTSPVPPGELFRAAGVDLLTVHAHELGRGNPQAHLVPLDGHDRDADGARDHDLFPDASCENQHDFTPLWQGRFGP
jgi:hypothetical protein